MHRVSVISSNIDSVGYSNGTLEIAFLSGGVYQYINVAENTYKGLLSAPSKGKYFNYYIKSSYPTIRVG